MEKYLFRQIKISIFHLFNALIQLLMEYNRIYETICILFKRLYHFNDAYIELIKKFISLLTIFLFSQLNGVKNISLTFDVTANNLS